MDGNPTRTTRPPARVVRRARSSALGVPAHSNTTSTPSSRNGLPRSGSSRTERASLRTAAGASSGVTACVAPNRSARFCWCGWRATTSKWPAQPEARSARIVSKPSRPGACHHHRLRRTVAQSSQAAFDGMQRAGERLEERRGAVREGIGDGVQLRLVCQADARPTAAGIGAVAGLHARSKSTHCQTRAALPPARAARGTLVQTTRRAGEHRIDHHACAGWQIGGVVECFTHDLVTGRERKRHQRRKVWRNRAGEQSEVRSADARQSGTHAHPARSRRARRGDVHESERRETGRDQAGSASGDHASSGVAQRRPVDL